MINISVSNSESDDFLFKCLYQVTNGNIKMSTCPLGLDSDMDDDINHPLNQFSRSLVRGKYACKLQDLLYQQSLQNSDFCDVTLHIDNSVSYCSVSVTECDGSYDHRSLQLSKSCRSLQLFEKQQTIIERLVESGAPKHWGWVGIIWMFEWDHHRL